MGLGEPWGALGDPRDPLGESTLGLGEPWGTLWGGFEYPLSKTSALYQLVLGFVTLVDAIRRDVECDAQQLTWEEGRGAEGPRVRYSHGI